MKEESNRFLSPPSPKITHPAPKIAPTTNPNPNPTDKGEGGAGVGVALRAPLSEPPRDLSVPSGPGGHEQFPKINHPKIELPKIEKIVRAVFQGLITPLHTVHHAPTSRRERVNGSARVRVRVMSLSTRSWP